MEAGEKMKRRFSLYLFLLALSNTITVYAGDVPSDEKVKNSIQSFASKMATKHQFDQQEIINQLSTMKYRQDILDKISRPAESMPWHKYRKIWMKDSRIKAGVKFWSEHQATLDRAEKVYGVDPAIIVSIIGVETHYGKFQGKYPVIEALHTLGFYYPKRAKFFASELAEYYLLARQEGWSMEQVKGSYAGAMGMGQFISSSYRRYAVDFNGDGKINLFSDPVDMIGSIANYFSQHHWKADAFVTRPIDLTSQQKKLVQSGLKLTHSPEQLTANGIGMTKIENQSPKVGVFAFDMENGMQDYWLAGHNFYVITRYNHSAMYALAVFQLSEAIRSGRLASGNQ